MNKTILIIIFVIAILIITFMYKKYDDDKYVEDMTTDLEAIANIASIYNLNNMKLTNIEATGDAKIGGNAIVSGKLNVPTTVGSFNLLPTGIIVAWSGTIATIPDGWALCDGTNGTPDLRGRFLVGGGDKANPAPAIVGSSATVPSAPNIYTNCADWKNQPADADYLKDSQTKAGKTCFGGSTSITLNLDQMPKHSHDVTGSRPEGYLETKKNGYGVNFTFTDRGGYKKMFVPKYDNFSTDVTYDDGKSGVWDNVGKPGDRARNPLGFTGGNKPFDNRPAYYAVAYIMKL